VRGGQRSGVRMRARAVGVGAQGTCYGGRGAEYCSGISLVSSLIGTCVSGASSPVGIVRRHGSWAQGRRGGGRARGGQEGEWNERVGEGMLEGQGSRGLRCRGVVCTIGMTDTE
jgi:hypothetical protein